MKKFFCILLALAVFGVVSAQAQFGVQLATPLQPTPDDSKLTRFNLDFHGGTPQDLVDAIEKASAKPLNAIIPPDDANIQLPPLKMNDVDALQLFDALEAASRQTVAVQSSTYGNSYTQETTAYGFNTSGNPITDSSIWYFFAQKPNLPPVVATQPICRFYQLQPYLERGFTVDDITTAVQTGWKMAGVAPAPELNYHKQTTLLIAYGKPDDLATVQRVLDSLPQLHASVTEVKKLDNQVILLQQQLSSLDNEVRQLSKSAAEKKSGN